MTESSSPQPDYDVIVIGAGFAGIYGIHKFRDQLGLRVHAFDAAGDVGGTWYWNRYPGSRVDIESVHYSYSFSAELQQEWHWTERYAAQPEILRYLDHVATRFDIRKDVTFNTRITSVTWDEADSLWVVGTDAGETYRSRFFVSGAGTLSVPKVPDFPGVDSFAGQVLLTGNWREDVDLAGKRVGLIGTGSSGIQAVSEIAKQARTLTVFQRTPNYATPIGNAPTDPAEEAANKARYADIRDASRNHFLGVPYTEVQPSALAVSAEERRSVFDDRWQRGGFRLFIDSYGDLLFDKAANDTAADYIRDRIRGRVADPLTAELLCPTDYPYGTKRPPLETDYYEAFNRPSVSLVDVRSNPVDAVVPSGVRLADGTVHELDVLILATGFDACTGPLLAMNIVGAGGRRLADEWADGPQTYLGLTVAGFPNLFMVTGPQSPSVLYNMPLAIEDHIDFIADALAWMKQHGHTVIDARPEAQDAWVRQTNELAEQTLLPTSKSTWYMGANIPGKPRRVLVYLGGAPAYRAICDEVVAGGYTGFAFGTAPSLDPAVAALIDGMNAAGFQSFEVIGLEASRAAIETFIGLQGPSAPVARVVEATYGAEDDQAVRVYVPHGDGPFPAVLYVHGGGFIGGSLDVVDEPARALAADLGAVVVSVTYRKAPEARFPSAHDDVALALEWVAANVASFGGDPSRLAVAGDSAGGNLVASAVARARYSGGPAVRAQAC